LNTEPAVIGTNPATARSLSKVATVEVVSGENSMNLIMGMTGGIVVGVMMSIGAIIYMK